MTKSAISQARQKLQASAFEALNDSLPGLLEERLTEMRGHSLRLVATDSTTTVPLPPQLENRAEFGVQLDSVGQSYVLARVLGLFASTSKRMLKAQTPVTPSPNGACWPRCYHSGRSKIC